MTKGMRVFIIASLFAIIFIGFSFPTQAAATGPMVITGVVDGPFTGGVPKAVELYVVNDIPDLSIYGLGSANNGGGTDGEEFTFPADSASAGDFIYVAFDNSGAPGFNEFFGFDPTYTESTATSINGDDAVELFENGAVIDVFGDINMDGTGQPWDYLDGWAYRVDGTGADGSTFVLENWTFSGINALDGETTNATAAVPFPVGSYSPDDTEPDYTPIYDIQYTEDVSGDSPFDGQEVTTEGFVTAVFYNGYFIQDGSGAWNGLWVYDSSAPVLGDRVRLTGTIDEYYNLTELYSLTDFQILSSGNALPDPVILTTAAANDEPFESVLVRVENVTVTAEEDSYSEWVVDDGSGSLMVDNLGTDTYVPVINEVINAIIGPLNFNFGAFKIAPRDDSDIILGSSDYTSIYDIQYTEEVSGDSPYDDQEVTTEGVVTAVIYNGYFIQDGSGAWNGLWVYDSNSPARGDRVRLTGTIDEYYNLTELTSLTDFQILSSGNTLPDPVVVSTAGASDEQYESVLIRVENVTVTAEEDSYSEWIVDDGSGPLVVDNIGADTYTPVLNDAIEAIVGPLNFNFGAFKIAPRDDNDIIFSAPPPAIVINEVHADPDSSLGDANNDGVSQYSDDEFVELVNNSDTDLNISSWTISDAVGVRHTFPAGTVVPANCSIVIFGGGTPTGYFGGSVVQTASSGALGLNNGGDSITLADGAADVVAYTYGSEGGNNQSLTRDPDIVGPEPLVEHSTATDSNGALFSPGTKIDGTGFAGCVSMYKIHDIQGSGLSSPLVGNTVVIEGIVVGDFQDGGSGTNGDLNGFYVQEEDADADMDALTSEGILVYDGYSPAVDVMVGDLVRVRGQVAEYGEVTEITNVSEISVVSSTNALPTPGMVTLPLAAVTDLEAYEGMLVTFPQALIISEYYNFDRYGEIVLTSERHLTPSAEYEPGPDAIQAAEEFLLDKITLDDGRSSQNPDPAIHPNGEEFNLENLFRGGDTVQNVTGVMDYYGGIYKIQPTQGADYISANPRSGQPEDVGGNIKVASFNVLNYFTTIDTGDWICGPSGDMECRGADDANEFERQRAKIIAALSDINADVVGLIEIENYPGDVPTADLVSGLNEILGDGTYDYVATGAIGTDAIRVALIYKPANVSLVGNYAVLDSSVDSRFLDDYNRPALAQTFQDNDTGGVFTVAVNHLKSKGSACDDNDDPDLGDGAGNCNVTRTLAAQALVDWLANDPTGSGDSDYLIIGDLNSYDKEDPIDAILAGSDDTPGTGDDFTDLLYNFIGEDAYSYVFDGQIGYLDHALASADLLGEVTDVTVWHINADEPDLIDYDTSFKQDAQDAIYAPDAYRSSDHDPVIIGLDVCDEIAPTVEVSLTKEVLWPANHKYVTVHAQVNVADNFDLNPTVTLLSVTSNEPDNGIGDGDTPNDIVILNDFTFKLRAERSGTGEGRIYTITYQVTDACGNSTVATATVNVPHNQ